MSSTLRPKSCLVVESGTDVRLVDGLSGHFDLTVISRRVVGGVEISHRPEAPVQAQVGPAGRGRFAAFVIRHLWKRRTCYQLVIVQGYGLAALAANVLGRVLRRRTVMLVCSPVEAYYRCRRARPEVRKPYRWWELLCLRALAKANAVAGQQYVVLSHHLAGVVADHGTASLVDVVPVYGVDTSVFAPPTQPKSEIRARLGLPRSGALIFFSSRIAPEKDSETLLVAVRQLVDDGMDLWVLHRSGGYERFVHRARELGVGDRVIATDAVHPCSQLPQDYQASDLCIQASREEGLGFSPLEALACELPVVASAVGGLKETVVDGQTGWTYPVGDVGALAQSIAAVLADPDEANRRARNGRQMVQARYERADAFARFFEVTMRPPTACVAEQAQISSQPHAWVSESDRHRAR